MFIQTEQTPNPATMKFIPGQPVMTGGTRDFKAANDADVSPLATGLFSIEGVEGVFFGADFVSVTKHANADWDLLKTHIMGVIMQHFMSGLPLITEEAANANTANCSAVDMDDEIVKQIVELIDTRVRPAVAQDGGDIIFAGFENGIVYLHMRGACSGCPSAAMTLKSGIEKMLKHYIPEVLSVEPAQEKPAGGCSCG